MIRRFLVIVPILALFFAAAVIVLAARAPRTWATHWTSPRSVSPAGGEYDFGVIRRGIDGWDLLWADGAAQKLVYTVSRGGHAQSTYIDSGDVSQPDLIQVGGHEIGTWVRNDNGRSVLMGAYLGPRFKTDSFSLVSSPAPLEHPTLVRTGPGEALVVFSWQHYGNFDLFSLPVSADHPHDAPHRLTTAQFYSFYPRGVMDARGTMHLLHLENCCGQKTWHVVYGRFNRNGKQLGRSENLATLESLSTGAPEQWPLAMSLDPAGHIWGAFAGDSGMYLFEVSHSGSLLRRPFQVDTEDGRPNSLSLALATSVGYLAWEQQYDLGSYVDVRRFDLNRPTSSSTERAVYASGSQAQPHMIASSSGATVVWELTARGAAPAFQTAQYRSAAGPTLAQRVGLGLGNPWEEIALLLLGALGFATLTTTVNILWVLILTFVGVVMLRALRWLPSKWLVYACVLTVALFFVFVSPGAPILFLDTMPADGLAVIPFGLMAFGAVLGFVTFVGEVPLRRVDDAYRAGLMAFLGIYFFAFLEAVVFIQQRLGYI